MEAAQALREQGVACGRLGSPLYAGLLARLADDVAAGGPTARVLAGHEDDPGPSALGLRLLGSVHRLVLERRAGVLAAYYPSVGGRWDPEAGAAAVVELLDSTPEAVREWLDRPPQTNEVGRAAALVGGLLHLRPEERLPVRLVELGASAGLNLLADRFRLVAQGEEGLQEEDAQEEDAATHGGNPASPVVLAPAWRGPSPEPWPRLWFAEATGCDLHPVDATTTHGRLALTAYVWPDQPHRHERLRGALALAAQTPPVVRRQGAADFLDTVELVEGTTTVVWHSVMWQYLPVVEQRRVTERLAVLAAAARPDARLAHLTLEPARREHHRHHEFLVELTTWPGGERRVLGSAPAHGLPVTWEDPEAPDAQKAPDT